MKAKIAIAGIGDLCRDLILKLLEGNFQITHIIVSSKSSSQQQSTMSEFAEALGIHIVNDFTHLTDEKIVFTPNFQQLIHKNILSNFNFVNIHFALLPRFRGYHPVQAGFINGDRFFGYTLHHIDEGIDSGPIYFQHTIEANEEDTTISITQRLSKHLCENIGIYFDQILNGLKPTIQNEENALYACMRHPEDGRINWNWNSKNIVGLVKALPPPNYPGAFTFYKDKKIIISKCSTFFCENYLQIPGQIINIQEDKLLVKTNDTAIWIERLFDEENACELVPTYFKRFVVGQKFN